MKGVRPPRPSKLRNLHWSRGGFHVHAQTCQESSIESAVCWRQLDLAPKILLFICAGFWALALPARLSVRVRFAWPSVGVGDSRAYVWGHQDLSQQQSSRLCLRLPRHTASAVLSRKFRAADDIVIGSRMPAHAPTGKTRRSRLHAKGRLALLASGARNRSALSQVCLSRLGQVAVNFHPLL